MLFQPSLLVDIGDISASFGFPRKVSTCMENSIVRAAANNTPSRLRTMTLDGTPRKAPLSAKKTKPQVCERLLASGAV